MSLCHWVIPHTSRPFLASTSLRIFHLFVYSVQPLNFSPAIASSFPCVNCHSQGLHSRLIIIFENPVMSITKVSLHGLAARLVITPSPVTLGESTAVLKKLQSFGPVTSFARTPSAKTRLIDPANESERQEVDVVFSSPDAVEKARVASPFTIRVNYGLPDPKVEDPYNVRNLQSRKQPRPKTMTCRVEPRDAWSLPAQTILSNGFSPSNTTRLYQSLLDTSPPSSIAAGLGVFHTDSSDIRSTAHVTVTPPDLMKMYHSPPGQSTCTETNTGSPTVSLAQEAVNPPVREDV